MRPRKEIVLYCANEHRLSLLRFAMLQQDGLKPLAARRPEELAKVVSECRNLGCVVILRDECEPLVPGFVDGYASILRLHVTTLQMLTTAPDSLAPVTADVTIAHVGNAELFAAVRIQASRRRGPKPRVKLTFEVAA